jgi:hypothetical protein
MVVMKMMVMRELGEIADLDEARLYVL